MFEDRFLPDPFLKEDGSRIQSPAEWPQQASRIRSLAEENMYGPWPGKPVSLRTTVQGVQEEYGGRAQRETVTLFINGDYPLAVEYIHPAGAGKHPVIVYNTNRLSMRSALEYETVITAGYGIASFDREMIRPDPQMAQYGGYAEEVAARKYPSLPCGDIMAWAWGHTAVASWLETREDTGALICTGHSRGGQAALCAGIFDERYQVVAPIGSGCGGLGCARFSGTLALDRQDEGKCETIGRMAHVFPTWMNEKYASFGTQTKPYPIGDEVRFFPLDAHMLRAACAPRAVFCSEGAEDFWANSFGTQLCRDAAQKVYDFLGVPDRNGFAIRPGIHAFHPLDWAALVDFSDIVLRRERRLAWPLTMRGPYVIDLGRYAPWAE